MREHFVYDGQSSANFHIYVANANKFDAPEKVAETIKIPGRNGALIVEDGSFLNVTVTYTVYTDWRLKDTLNAFRNFLNASEGYKRLEDTFHPDEFRMARFSGAFEVSSSDRKNAGLSVSFDCKPQRFLKSGEKHYILTSSGKLKNPTAFPSKPLYKVSGNGSFTVNGVKVTVTGNSGVIYIDTTIMDAYSSEGENKNSCISMTECPCLVPGSNDITINGLNSLEIVPYWWTL